MVSIGILLLTAIEVLTKGFVFMTLWGWFIVPKFDLLYLSLAESLGVCICVSVATLVISNEDADRMLYTKKPQIDDLIYPVVRIICLLSICGFGFVYSLFL